MVTDMKSVTTEPMSIGDLLSSRVPFEVPAYQRTYAWTTDELGDFVTDVLDIYRIEHESPASDELTDHFFGGLVSVQHEVATKIGHRFELVDGQQRTTTFFMTLRLIEIELRGLANTDDDLANDAIESANYIQSEFLMYRDREAGGGSWVTAPRLRLSRIDHPFFRELIDGQGPSPVTASHRKLRNAWNYLARELIRKGVYASEKLSREERFKRLSSLQAAITERSFVIHIRSLQRRQAYRLFSVLNDRGRALTDGDLLRARTLELLEDFEEHHEPVAAAWESVLVEDDAKVSKYLSNFFGSSFGRRAPRRDLFDTLMTRYFEVQEGEHLADYEAAAELRRRVRRIADEWPAYQRLVAGEWPYEEAAAGISNWAKARLDWLVNVLGHDSALPLLLAGCLTLDQGQFARLCLLLERFAFRHRTMGQGHASLTQDLYFKLAAGLRDGTMTLQDVKTALNDAAKVSTPDSVFRAALTELRYSERRANGNIRYFLATLNDYYGWFAAGAQGDPRPDSSSVIDPRIIDIEHIYPQSPQPGQQDSALEPLLHGLGNLTFWDQADNRAVQNEPFSSKRRKYAGSKIALTAELAKFEDFSIAEVESRQDRLVEMGLAIFGLDD